MSQLPSLSGSLTPFVPPIALQTSGAHFPLTSLFPDLQTLVFSHLKPASIASVAMTCKTFNQLAKQDHLLTLLFQNLFSSALSIGNTKGFSCLDACKKQHRVHQNFDKGVYRLSTLSGHEGAVYVCAFYGTHLVTGGMCGEIKIWDLEEKKCLKTLKGLLSGVNRLITLGDTLISTDYGGSIKIWDLTSGQCLKILDDHVSYIFLIAIVEESLISCSQDGNVLFWNIKTWERSNGYKLENYEGNINAFAIEKNRLITGHDDKLIRLWDLETGAFIRSFEGHKDEINALVPAGGRLVSGGKKGSIKTWDLESGECLKTLEGHNDYYSQFGTKVNSLSVAFDRIISSSWDKSIKIWDLESGQLLTTLIGHQDTVWSANVEGTKLISCSSDHTINIWDFEASDKVILEQIAQEFRNVRCTWDKKFDCAIDRFSRMPEKIKMGVYKQLRQIFDRTTWDYWTLENLERVFNSKSQPMASCDQRARALERFAATLPDR